MAITIVVSVAYSCLTSFVDFNRVTVAEDWTVDNQVRSEVQQRISPVIGIVYHCVDLQRSVI